MPIRLVATYSKENHAAVAIFGNLVPPKTPFSMRS
jgi:hypothetical protein